MNENKFVHLHLHTEYSLLDGINRINTIPEYIKSIGQSAVSMTDHGNVSGSYSFFKSCKKAGVKPIIGMEAYYTVGDRTVREVDDLEESYYHLVLIAMNNTGLKKKSLVLPYILGIALRRGIVFHPVSITPSSHIDNYGV